MGILVWFFGNFLAVLSILKYLALSHHVGVLAAIFLMECAETTRPSHHPSSYHPYLPRYQR